MSDVIDHTGPAAEVRQEVLAGLARRLRQRLDERGWSPTDLAAASGVIRQAINQILAGGTAPRVDVAARLADALGVGRGWLVYGG